ncbi:MAG: xanthine dehydrogenase [Amycolatopsis sp.]|uniref:xanthine dehydrogenase family protein molybdopterin-binding subunit n=1 Tax=Amycolatopsis sp. TaxID=37632 RepID=UPI00260A5A4E|nr:xanthine dehydrogenase family protein molybdopterin-binding subunit [Amycolatopsis sp.]MCU1682031.1 xanthine dehydrogenase [Amycolatopsis sp.]
MTLTQPDSATTAGSLVGRSVRRKDGDLVLTGKGGYLDDIEFPGGVLHAALLRSPHPAARILRVDTTAAVARPGVRVVLTGAEAAKVTEPLPHFYNPAMVGGATTDFHPLAVDVVHYVGEPVAAVVAGSLQEAQAAVRDIVVDYELLPFVLDTDAAMAPDAPVVFDGWADNAVCRLPFAEGDATAKLAAAPHTLSGEIFIQRYQTTPMETRGYVATWSADRRLTLYASTQNPHPLRSHLAQVLGMAESDVQVVAPRLGGGFGHKFHSYPEESLLALLARQAGAPVKWLESREESLLVGAREYVHRFEVGFDDTGRILALKDRIRANVGALGPSGGWAQAFVAGLTLPGPYKIDDYDVEMVPVATHKAPWNGARGYGKESAALLLERVVDLVAQRLDLDPAEVRRRNLIPVAEMPYWTATKHIDGGDYHAALDQVLQAADYPALRARRTSARSEGQLFGIGISFELAPEGADLAGSLVRGHDTATVRVDRSGRVTVLTGVTSPGSGNETGIAQLVAAELGVGVDDVRVKQGDTDLCPYGYGNFSSRSLTVGGAAAVLAARDVRATLAQAAASLLKTEAACDFADGHVIDTGTGERLPLPVVVNAVMTLGGAGLGITHSRLESTRTYTPENIHLVPDAQGRVSVYPSYSHSAHVVSAEVDRETGQVKLLSFVGLHDCGTVVNPMLVRGQFLGAIAMGIGGALWEESVYGADGRLRSDTLKRYLLPRSTDLPFIETVTRETPSPFSMFGVKGAGESGVGGALAAVANAVNDALLPLGVYVHHMPLSAPRLLSAIKGARS